MLDVSPWILACSGVVSSCVHAFSQQPNWVQRMGLDQRRRAALPGTEFPCPRALMAVKVPVRKVHI